MSLMNGQVKFVVIERLYHEHPDILRTLVQMVEHPPYNGIFSIHWVNGKISHARKEETVREAS